MDIQLKTGTKDEAFDIRTKVFIDEQGFSHDLEFDEIDDWATHITLFLDDVPVGCARVFQSPDNPEHYLFGRLAVLEEARKKGFGMLLLEKAEETALTQGGKEIHLHAQCHAQGFYTKCGYEPYGPIEFEEHVEHVWMKKLL